jgi:hypothetical protein
MAPAPTNNAIAALVEDLDAERTPARPRRSVASPGLRATRRAYKVTFADSAAVAYFPADSLVTVLRANRVDPLELGPRELRPGDRVVFVDRGIATSVHDVVNEQLARSPRIGPAAQLLRVWYRALNDGYKRSRLSYDRLLQRIRGIGSTITHAQTVRLWLRGGVIGPRDLDDIDRLATVLGVGQRSAGTIADIRESIPVLRRVHRRYARIVFRTCIAGGVREELSDPDEELLEAYGLDLGSLQGVISTLTVGTVSSEPELVASSLVGRQVERSHAA